MSALQDRFAQAQEDVNRLAERPDNNTMLKLYALYKQATKGHATGERPGGFDFVARAKFDAWSEMEGTSAEDAMQQYIDLVASLVGAGITKRSYSPASPNSTVSDITH